MPKIKFSALAISALKPQKKVVEYFDGTGFGIRVNPTGLMTWFIIYRSPINGKVKRYSIGKYPTQYTLKQARKEAKKKLTEIADGEDPQQKKKEIAKSDTFEDLFDNYMTHHAIPNKRPSSVKEDQRIFNAYLQSIKDAKACKMSRRDIISLHDEISEKTPVMANRVIALVSTVFSKGIERELIETTPCIRIKSIMTKESPRARTLSDIEIKTLWPALDTLRPNMRDIFKLILFTGQRPGEIMSMRVDELDFDMTIKVTRTDGKLEVEVEVDCPVWLLPSSKTKNERPHFVPLSPQVVEIIKNRVTESPWIFPSVYNKNQSGHTVSTKNARYKLHKDTGIKKWTAHDLRRTARTLMSRFGVRPHIAEKVINHSEGRMFQVYDHFDYLEEKQKALLVLASKIEKITN